MRRRATLLAACLAAATVAIPAASAADGPVLVHDHASINQQLVFSLSSSAAGTVYSTWDRRALLVPGALTPEAQPVDLEADPDRGPWAPYEQPSIVGTRVAVPREAGFGTPTTVVDWCLVGTCPDTETFTTPAGYRYLGNGDDVAVLYHRVDHVLALAPWAGGDLTLVPLGDEVPAPIGAYADTDGVALWSTSGAAYVARPSLAVTVLPGTEVSLTPTWLVFTAVVDSSYVVKRVPRATPDATPTVELTLTTRPRYLVASDSGVAYAIGTTDTVHTATWDGEPVAAGPLVWRALGPSADGTSFLAYLYATTGSPRAVYAITPGTTTKTLVHTPPAVPATTTSVSVSHGRVAWTDDSSYSGTAFVRPFDGGAGGAETAFGRYDHVALSGPYVAGTRVSGGTVEVGYGRVGGVPKVDVFGGGDGTRPYLSGRRLLLTGGSRSTLVDVRSGAAKDLGNVVAAIHGDTLVTATDTGEVARTDLLTGNRRVVRGPSCASNCAVNRPAWRLAAWGDDVLYAIELNGGRSAALWSKGTTTTLPMLAAGWTELAYRDGLLLRYRAGDGVHLDNLRNGANVVVDAAGALPPGTGLDGTLVAWRASALRNRAGIRPLADLLPGYTPAPRLLNADVPQGVKAPGSWRPAWYTSDDVPWTLTLYRKGHLDPVKTLSGTSVRGEIAPVWDGSAGGDAAAPHGWYVYQLSTPAGTRGGHVFLSRTAPRAPTVTAPVLASDQSPRPTVVVRFGGAPAGHRYRVERSTDKSTFVPVATTTSTSMTVTMSLGSTYRFRVRIVDPAGRVGPSVTRTTVKPDDDGAAVDPLTTHSFRRSYDGRHWRGSQLRTTEADNHIVLNVTGDGIWLIGPRGPSYGRFSIRVDGGPTYVVDAYSPTTKFRQVLFKTAVKYGGHYVEITTLPTPGRPTVGIDGIAGRIPH